MNEEIKLTLEQEFSLRNFADQARKMSREQAQEFLIEQNQLMVMREILYQRLLKYEWKLDIGFASLTDDPQGLEL